MRVRPRHPYLHLAGVALLVTALPASGQGASGGETAGWHLARPGEDLEAIARQYFQKEAKKTSLKEANPQLEAPEPGDRVLVRLEGGLPENSAIVGRLAGQVEALPAPVPWTRSRRFDLLATGDAVRTHASASAEMLFADTSRLLLTEDSLVFLYDDQAPRGKAPPLEVEIIEGQADLRNGTRRRSRQDGIEILMGGARAKPKADRQGRLEARAKREPGRSSQFMVYQGESRLEAGGRNVTIQAGEGSVVPPQGPPSIPERLLAAPAIVAPLPGASFLSTPPSFRWEAVGGAATYTLEICLDRDCGQLVQRLRGMEQPGVASTELTALSPGRYFWRVTATAASQLDGYPSVMSSLTIARPEGEQVAATSQTSEGGVSAVTGSVRSRPAGLPLPGVRLLLLETGEEAATARDGTFRLTEVPSGIYTLEAHLPGFVVGRLENVIARPGAAAEVTFVLTAAPLIEEEIIVTPSRVSLMSLEPVSPLGLSRSDMLSLPHLGDDVFRVLPLLPGATANDVSAEFHIRGGRRDEVQILLDGQELYGAFHLKDYDNALSIVAPASLANVDLTTGGFSASFGDRMGGVLDMTSLNPEPGRRTRLGLSLLSLQLGSSGTTANEQGSWLVLGRRGSLDLAGRLFSDEKPTYWDFIGKASFEPGERQTVSGRVLHSSDSLDFIEQDGLDFSSRTTRHDNTFVWLTHQALVSPKLFVDSHLSWSDITSRRIAIEDEEEQQFDVFDERGFDVAEARQQWQFQTSSRHYLTGGAGYREFEAPYDYRSFRNFDIPIALIRSEPREGELNFLNSFSGDHVSAHVSDRFSLGESLKLELGLRYDRHSLQGESRLSPRVNAAYSLSSGAVLRGAWGHFTQSQRPYELQVQDAETTFAEIELSEQTLVGFEKSFQPGSRMAGFSFRAELYDRRIDNPRIRFESLYEPFNPFPELEPERVRIVPEKSRAQGLELFLRGRAGGKIGWWLNYTLAKTEDRIAGRWVPRQIDQTHALNLSVEFPLGRRWRMNLAFRGHSGWPTTPLSLEERFVESDEDSEPGEDGEMEAGTLFFPVLGPLNSQRLSTHHRLDLRASREIRVKKGSLSLFIDIQNVYNRRNHAGFEFEIDQEEGEIVRIEERWPGTFPSIGIEWEF